MPLWPVWPLWHVPAHPWARPLAAGGWLSRRRPPPPLTGGGSSSLTPCVPPPQQEAMLDAHHHHAMAMALIRHPWFVSQFRDESCWVVPAWRGSCSAHIYVYGVEQRQAKRPRPLFSRAAVAGGGSAAAAARQPAHGCMQQPEARLCSSKQVGGGISAAAASVNARPMTVRAGVRRSSPRAEAPPPPSRHAGGGVPVLCACMPLLWCLSPTTCNSAGRRTARRTARRGPPPPAVLARRVVWTGTPILCCFPAIQIQVFQPGFGDGHNIYKVLVGVAGEGRNQPGPPSAGGRPSRVRRGKAPPQ